MSDDDVFPKDQPPTRFITTHLADGVPDPMTIEAPGERNPAGANALYRIATPMDGRTLMGYPCVIVELLRFRVEPGGSGLTNEALLAIVADRLEGFQAGAFACDENRVALDAVNAALDALKGRAGRVHAARGPYPLIGKDEPL